MNNENKMYKDFIKAQKEFEPARKSSKNPFHKSMYADLSSCIDAVKEALNNNGFAIIQNVHGCDKGVAVETILMHEDGGSIRSGILNIPASKEDAQAYGSAISYGRRYTIKLICCLSDEDDDGNAATNNKGNYQTSFVPCSSVNEVNKKEKSFEETRAIVIDRLKELGCCLNDALFSLGKSGVSEIDKDDLKKLIEIGKSVASGELSPAAAFNTVI